MNEVSMNLNPHHQDNDSLDVDQIYQLIGTLYNSKNTTEQSEANRRLTELLDSDRAWQICWTLLDINRYHSMEAHFFAANALVLKINQSWQQQNSEWLEKELRPKLFELLFNYASSSNGDKVVIGKLSLALATFALHSIPTFWPDAIEHILQSFSPQNLSINIPPRRICDILLKILMYIPEEYSVLMPQQDHRAKLNFQITKSGPIVFKFLHSLLVADKVTVDADCRQSVLKCLTSWTLHSRTSLLEMVDGKLVLDILYDLIADEDQCGPACSALAATFSNQKAENYRNSVIDFIPKIANLKQIIDKYTREDDIESAIKIYSLVINFSENHSRLYLKIVLGDGVELESSEKTETIKQAIFTTIRIILDCTTAPGIYGIDEKYSDISFTFWFTFLENFCYYSDSFNDILCDTFDPLVDSLLQTLIIKSRYPDSTIFYKVWTDDQRETYRCYRQDIGDNVSLLVQFPRSRDRILEQLNNLLQQKSENIIREGTVNMEVWQDFESVVFALKSMSESIPFDETKSIPKVFAILSQIQFHRFPPLLYCTVAEMISAYSDWLFTHNTHLSTAFEILFIGVNSSDSYVRLMSTLSLKDLTAECQSVLQPFAKQIVESCTRAITQHSCNLSTNEKARLMHTIGTTLAVCPVNLVHQSLNVITMPLICELASKTQIEPSIDPTARSVILDKLTMLNSLIESLYRKPYSGNDYEDGDENDPRFHEEIQDDVEDSIQPALGLLSQLVPILTQVATKYRSDEQIMEIISNTIKRSSKSLGVELKPIVRDFLIIIVGAYDPLYNSNILDGCVPLYNLFKIDTSLHPYLRDAFARISNKTLEVCLGNPLRQLSMTIENYFRYTCLICKKFPEFLTEPPSPTTTEGINVEYIYKLAVASLELPERRTLIEVCNFLTQFKQKSVGIEHLHRIFAENLSQVLYNIFNIFGGNYTTPRNAIENVTDLLFFIIDSDQAREPLKLIVAKENFPTTFVNCDQKSRFVSKIIHEKNRKKFKDACSEFVLLARNLNRTT